MTKEEIDQKIAELLISSRKLRGQRQRILHDLEKSTGC